MCFITVMLFDTDYICYYSKKRFFRIILMIDISMRIQKIGDK